MAYTQYAVEGRSIADKMFYSKPACEPTKPCADTGLIILCRPIIRDKEDANKHKLDL
jgi:hypothetical protein